MTELYDVLTFMLCCVVLCCGVAVATCDWNAWADAAAVAATAMGIDVNSYNFRLYYVPSEPSCGFGECGRCSVCCHCSGCCQWELPMV